MTDPLGLLWGTARLRPYVLAFLAVHAWSAVCALGARRVAALTGIVWAAAFAAEWTSTRVGFPFGLSVSTRATRGQELYLSNVPFMDFLSFTFLGWASYALALVLTRPRGRGIHRGGALACDPRTAPATLAMATACFVLIDVIIDPLAVRGDRWFLGPIFEYPDGGTYFGVPLSNFGGWAVVGAVAFVCYAALDRRWGATGRALPANAAAALPWGAALWFAGAAFNLLITFAIGEAALGFAGVTIAGSLAAGLAARRAPRARQSPSPDWNGGGRAARAWQREPSHP